jgi:Predicted ATPase (AAA+ superfamily)
MERKLLNKLVEWKNSPDRKPLILRGARQVGKSYLLQELFAKRYYENCVYVDLEKNVTVSSIFDGDLLSGRIIPMLELATEEKINPGTTLIILDEIQSCPRALLALKEFCDNAPQYHIVSAGSLLGVALNRNGSSYPVGKVDELELYPMDMEEFFWAIGQKALSDMAREHYENDEKLDNAYHEMALKSFQKYLVIGGMPEVVKIYIETGSFIAVQNMQRLICSQYIADMSKYPEDYKVVRIRACYDSLPAQLAKENRKFQYKVVKKGSTSTFFEESIEWLQYAGIGLKCTLLKSIQEPLSAYADNDSFKVYASDTGLLLWKSGFNVFLFLSDLSVDNTFMGGVIENYVATALKASGHKLYYWTSEGKAEIDFVIDIGGKIMPVEVKKSERTKSRSLSVFNETFKPEKSIRISARNFGFEDGIKSVPLYSAFCIQ